MRLHHIVAVAVAVIASAAVHPVPAAAAPPATEVRQAIETQLAATGTPGAAWAVVDTEGIAESGMWGVDGDGEAVESDTAFLWGSIAKPVTAAAVLKLAETGRLELDAPVSRYLPRFRPQWNGADAAPTVKQLLTQTAGLPDDGDTAVTDRGDHRADAVSRTADELNTVDLASKPGSRFEYASGNYLLLGAVVEAVTGEHYAAFLDREILTPWGMTDVITTPRKAADRLPVGHRQFGGIAVSHSEDFDVSGVPYGYLAGDIEDLAAFTAAQLAGGNGVLAPESVAQAQRKHTDSTSGGYGYGWSVGRLPGTKEPIVWHSGATPGYQSMLVLLPETHQAVIVLQNTYSMPRETQLLNAAFSAAGVVAGQRPETYEPDTVLLLLPWFGGLIAIGLLIAAVRGLRGARQRPKRPALHIGVWAVSAAGVAVLLLAVVPWLIPASWRLLWIWVPDLAIALWSITAASALLAAIRIVRLLHSGTEPSAP